MTFAGQAPGARASIVRMGARAVVVTVVAVLGMGVGVTVAVGQSPGPSSSPSAQTKDAPRDSLVKHAPDACVSPWVKSLGGVPCETRTDTKPLLLCEDFDRPYYETRHWFRVKRDGAWTPWGMYYRTYRPAPRSACN